MVGFKGFQEFFFLHVVYESRIFTWYSVVTASLHIEGCQVQSNVGCKGKQSLSKSIHHHVVLCIQFCWPTNQSTQQRIDAPYTKSKVEIK